MVVSSSKRVVKDRWVKATWEEFVEIAYSAEYQECSAYFDSGEMRLEMPSLGIGHARQNGVVWDVITFFTAFKNIDITKYVNASFQKAGEREFQPDAAFYIGKGAKYLPPQNNSPVNVDLCGLPSLVVEVGATSIKDDLGLKRILYERIGIAEYWVVDVAVKEVIAFSIGEDRRSGVIRTSEVLPGLEIGIVEEALRRSEQENDGAIAQWLMKTFNSAA